MTARLEEAVNKRLHVYPVHARLVGAYSSGDDQQLPIGHLVPKTNCEPIDVALGAALT